MAVTHVTAVRNEVAELITAKLDAGAGAGYMEFQTSGDVMVSTHDMSDPAFGAATAGVCTAGAIADDTNAVGGTIAKAVFFDSDDVPYFACSVTVTSGGGDIEMNSVIVSAGQTVQVNSLTYESMP